jgi:hypothetical protein
MDTGATETSVASLPKQRSSEYREYYANNCQVRFTPFDVTISFTFIKEGSDGNVINEVQTAVTLNPGQFKALILTGGNLLGGFEQTFGEIKLPTGVGPQFGASQIASELQALPSVAATSSTDSGRRGGRSRSAAKKKA